MIWRRFRTLCYNFSMYVTVKISSTLRNLVEGYDPLKGIEVEAAPGQTVAGLLRGIGIPMEKVKVIMVNGLNAPPDRELSDGDRVGVFPPVGGG